MDGDSWAVDVVQALAVPLAILIAVVILRRPIGEFFASVGGRISKLSVGWVSVELSTAEELRPSWTVDMNGRSFDVRQLSPADVFDSYADSLLRQLAEPGVLDYAVVDLGTGESWLTTRLFLFAELLHRMRGLRAFVFVQTNTLTQRGFVGYADVERVRWRLGRTYPELEIQLAQAYSQAFGVVQLNQTPPVPVAPVVVSDTGSLEPWRASLVARRFLDSLQFRDPPANDHGNWVHLKPEPPQPEVWERAAWLDVGDVLRLLDPELVRDHIVERDDQSIDRAAQVGEVVACTGDYVAVVRNGTFDRLIDRQGVVEKVARQAMATMG
jgi:hypothetical protein